ncbi:xanthine/uracil transporter family protein [Alkalihalophilus pseudofirmus OF4]|uniref:Xanthine/uracil transporter family protein n=2 Tax=Alkalihalophilus pseudofirmus TaxID=79885 RepID=D3FTB2_ALKPO|nr:MULTISPECIES: solute carrier family 23 protein [Alkalihalophilus]ADC48180.1 xanthine/uracil transporter family protein [Alkalihalophilus pseudofirmus OF4]MDV2885348.1 solute carrier family 23 protein [Alkalihalophilus pseudofirmus]MED1602214.1 solute carrier family 23 protein [Alkalihalophilus marmarensis]OLS37405.1 uracil permease [Alkalihalophilus pseudofirmus]WEG15691.1 solute carrier family 23 protein [Alkalihalophilus pseudofirmus]
MKQQTEIGIRDIPRFDKWFVLSLQHLCAMFGATILVPFLVGLSPSVALLSSGLGTLAYLLITKGQVPAYLGSSFAFIAPILAATSLGGPEGAMLGSFLAGLVYGAVALLIKTSGVGWIMKLLPPIVVGPVIIVIGLGLAGVAIDMAMYIPGLDEQVYSTTHFTTALVTLLITIIVSMFFKGFLGLVPIMFGIIGGYLFAYTQGLVDFTPVREAAWIAAPEMLIPFVSYTPQWSWAIAFIMMPIAVVTIAEHIGDQMVLSKVVGKNFIKKPGLHRSILGDGVATMIASFIGGPPNTTYGENIGVLAITRVFSVFVIGGAATLAIGFAFIGKISALISTIPTAVMGGVSILLFGVIASSGLRMLIDNNINLGSKRNLIISSVILVIGIGGAFIQVTDEIQLAGMALATIIGMLLHLVLPNKEESYSKKDPFAEDEKQAA